MNKKLVLATALAMFAYNVGSTQNLYTTTCKEIRGYQNTMNEILNTGDLSYEQVIINRELPEGYSEKILSLTERDADFFQKWKNNDLIGICENVRRPLIS